MVAPLQTDVGRAPSDCGVLLAHVVRFDGREPGPGIKEPLPCAVHALLRRLGVKANRSAWLRARCFPLFAPGLIGARYTRSNATVKPFDGLWGCATLSELSCNLRIR